VKLAMARIPFCSHNAISATATTRLERANYRTVCNYLSSQLVTAQIVFLWLFYFLVVARTQYTIPRTQTSLHAKMVVYSRWKPTKFLFSGINARGLETVVSAVAAGDVGLGSCRLTCASVGRGGGGRASYSGRKHQQSELGSQTAQSALYV